MRFYNVEMRGKFFLEKRTSPPSYESADESRMYYYDNSVYVTDSTSQVQLFSSSPSDIATLASCVSGCIGTGFAYISCTNAFTCQNTFTVSGPSIAVCALSPSGNAVLGISGSNRGLAGCSCTGPGVYAYSCCCNAIQGNSFYSNAIVGTTSAASNAGVFGCGGAAGSIGVCGRADAGYGGQFFSSVGTALLACSASGNAGVYGCATGPTVHGVLGTNPTGPGVLGCSTSSYGVYGCTQSGYGIFGYACTSGIGVYGCSLSTSGVGVYGSSASGASAVGVYGINASGIGVGGFTDSGTGVYGCAETSGYAARFTTSGATGILVCGDKSTGYLACFINNHCFGNTIYAVAGCLSGTAIRGYVDSGGGNGVQGVNCGSALSSNAGVCGLGTGGNGVCGQSTNGIGVAGRSSNCWGVAGYSTTAGGVLGFSPGTAVCGCNTAAGAAVSGNGAYTNTSSKYLKHLSGICVGNCLKETPLNIYKYYWEDANTKGFDQYIGPTAEDFNKTFGVYNEDTGDEYVKLWSVDGVALALGIENLKDIDKLKDVVTKLYACIQKLEGGV